MFFTKVSKTLAKMLDFAVAGSSVTWRWLSADGCSRQLKEK
jgi:hypothetical protein